MSTEEEAKYTCRLEDAIAEYEKAKAMYDEWWSEEKLDALDWVLSFISGEPLPIKKVGNYWLKENGLSEVCFTIERAINAYKAKREYWHNILEEKVSDIACIVPFGKQVELDDGRIVEGILEAY